MVLDAELIQKQIEEIQEKLCEYDNQINQLYDILDESVTNQSKHIKRLESSIQVANEQIYELKQQLQSLKHHLDNGWKADLINKMLEQNTEYMNKLLAQNVNHISNLIDSKLKLQFEEKKQQIEADKLKTERKVVDVNKLLLTIFASGGVVYMILDIIRRLIGK